MSSIRPTIAVSKASLENSRLASVGLDSIRRGEVAVILPLGGLNTRGGGRCRALVDMAHTTITPLDIHGSALSAIRSALCRDLTVVLITSRRYHDDIHSAVANRGFYGFSPDRFVLVEAPSIPLIHEGNPVLDGEGSPIAVPGGHGEVPRVLTDLFPELEARGVKYINYSHVSNLLEHLLDPLFVGYCIDQGVGSAVKVVSANRARPHMGRVGERADGMVVCVPHHDAQGYENWRELHGNLGGKFFVLSLFKECAHRSLPTYTVPHFLSHGHPLGVDVVLKQETSILDVLNLCQKLRPFEVDADKEYFGRSARIRTSGHFRRLS
jgi:UDP-N-acetylglucosamine pyrophosphorylase